MRETLQNRCALFAQNRDAVKSAFWWESSYLYPLCASLYAAQNKAAEVDAMKECRDLLKKNTGLFSNFRGTARLATITMLALSDDPQQLLEHMLYVYGKLKEVFWASEYLTIAAASIAQMAPPEKYDEIVRATRGIYEKMKEAHPLLTNNQDSGFAALLALSGLDDREICQEMERCYQVLKPSFFSANAVQSLSMILALGHAPTDEKCQRVMDLFTQLKGQGRRYGTHYELPTLGVLALLEVPVETLAADMLAADDYLKGCHGFGWMGVGAKQRLMYAGTLTMNDYVPSGMTMETAALNGVVALVIAQQAAMCASVAAASATASNSSGSSTQ